MHYHRGFFITTVWTLGLLWLGSVVHATGSSLACPDWPTCYGTMIPEMTGGVFWEHLHRLVAGGLVLIFAAATYTAWKSERRRPALRWWAVAGIGFLLVQSVLGGLTVLMQLPDAVSTAHLALAFLFLGLATALTVATSPRWTSGMGPTRGLAGLRTIALGATMLTFLQSVLGGVVRHMDAGLVCPDIPLCLGRWVPPLETATVVVHFGHRVLGIGVLATVLVLSARAIRELSASTAKTLAVGAGVLAVLQVGLGFLTVHMRLAVVPASLHTLVAATILSLTTALAVMSWAPEVVLSDSAGAGTAAEAAARV